MAAKKPTHTKPLVPKRMDRDFGGFAKFASHFKTAAIQVEGSCLPGCFYHTTAMQLLVMQAEKQQKHGRRRLCSDRRRGRM